MQNQLAEFHGTTLNIIDHAGRRWLTAEQAGLALGYNKANARIGIQNLYSRHADEFTEADTGVINLITPGGRQDVRCFTSSGCIKLGFFASTGRAKEFRAWAAKVLDGQPAPVPAALPAARCTITRRIERQVFELFVAGLRQKQIALELAVSPSAVNQLLHAKYRFVPAAGAAECSPELIAAVAARHLEVEREKLLEAQERIAQKFLCSANNQPLARALDAVGQQLVPLARIGGAA